ncbi:uncharacterized protein LOC121889589 isoform X2 [Thunnus maccoyii]|uniref:uncharacterized protein LOC121889589 isoform X2 n=2 Tax=Thunnus maccoyii TaxID=8240 RepID=UPI001C4AB1DD|nr:uncharacterized protein LOC121889589 isoform X2 [Thunnus maccoyii]
MTLLYVKVHVVRHTSVVLRNTFALFCFIMAGHLLLVFLIYSFHEMKAQASLPPKLTVNPQMITETDSVTLNCQAPASVSVTECFFRTNGKPAKSFPCMTTLTGTELLKITNQSPPAEVKVTCFYLVMNPSPDSDVSSIIIQPSLHPKLTVNPQMITETDSVTLNCQTPPSVSVSQCYFYTLSGGTISVLSCLQTLTGTELLKMAHQSLPTEIEVKCFYTAMFGDTYSQSPHSDSSSITIQSQKPEMSYQHFDGDSVLFTCSLPGSANHDTRCNLYFGEASHPVKTTTIRREMTSTNQKFCQLTVSIDDLLTHLRSVLRKDASCDYTLGSEPSSLSPRSDRYSLTDIVDKESSKMQKTPKLTMTTVLLPPELTVNPLVITETDLIMLNCQTPPSVSVSQCYFYTLSGGTVRVLPCLQTLTGIELLKMAHQSSPAEIKVKCYYTVTRGETKSTSPHSDTTSITIQSLPSYRRVSTPVKPTSGQTVGKPTNTGSSTSTSLSPVKTTSGTFTGIAMTSPDAALTNQASNDEITETWIWKLVVVVAGFGVTVGVILLGFAPFYNQSTIEKCAFKRPKAIITDYRDYMNLQAGYDETYSMVIYKCNIEKCAFKRPKAIITDYRDYMNLQAGYDETYSMVIYKCNIEKCAFKRPKAIITDYRDYMNLQAGYDETYSMVIYKCNIE